MKKLILLALCALMLTSCSQKAVTYDTMPQQNEEGAGEHDHAGHTHACELEHADFEMPHEISNKFEYKGYIFYRDENGNSVVAKECPNDCGRYAEAEAFLAVEATEETFDEIEVGMTVNEVVKLVGIPLVSATTDILSMDFLSADDQCYRVYFNNDMTVSSYKKVS